MSVYDLISQIRLQKKKKEKSNNSWSRREEEVLNTVVVLGLLPFVTKEQMILSKVKNQEIEHIMYPFNVTTKRNQSRNWL